MKFLEESHWDYIQEKYPKAYAKLVGETAENKRLICDQFGCPVEYLDDDKVKWSDDDLFLFFDSLDIITLIGINTSNGHFIFSHFNRSKNALITDKRDADYTYRQVCLSYAILTSFEYLERALSTVSSACR